MFRYLPALLSIVIPAAASPVVFEHINSRDGLAHNSVAAILQDRSGFLWIGTLAGLNRFDGVEFEVWRHDAQDPDSLSSNHVTALLEDRAGNLWVGTDHGLDRLEQLVWEGERFHHYSIPGQDGSRVTSPVRALYQDQQDDLWAGLTTGLLRHVARDDRIEYLHHVPGDPRSLAPGIVYGIQEDAAARLWVLTARAPENRDAPSTLNRLAEDGSGFERFPMPEGWHATGFLIDRDNKFWINATGLGTFDAATGRFQGPLLMHPYQAQSGLWQDRDGALWISTTHGFLRYQPDSGDMSGPYPAGVEEDLLSGFAIVAAEDHSGTLWLGTRGGIYKWDRRRKPFHHLSRQPGDAEMLSSDRVSAVLEDSSGSLWLGTFGAGLNRFEDLATPPIQYRHDPDDPSSLCHDTIWHMAEDRGGDLWLGIDGGLCRYRRSVDRFRSYPLAALAAGGGDLSVRFVVAAASGDLWLASDAGLYSFDPDTATLRRYGSREPDGAGNRMTHFLYPDGTGSLWLGTQGGGLEELDLATGTVVRHQLTTDSGHQLRSEGIFAIRAANGGGLWLASGDGLSRYQPSTGNLEHYAAPNGLPGSSVYSLLEDDGGRLWLGTDHGLSRFDDRLPSEPRFRNFDLSDGIGNLEFNRHAAHRTRDGRLLFGGMNGLTSFRPQQIRDNPTRPPVALTRVRVWTRQGESVFHPGARTDLLLAPRQNSIAFEFAALDFTNDARNRYAYRLQGFDNDWIDNGTRRFARYHRLPPGRYRFQVKASNNDGRWNHRGAALSVRILPPFWHTWWFRIGLLAALAAVLAAAHRFGVNRLLEIERLRTRIAGDLHDDLSSELSGIALAMEVLQQGQLDAEHKPRLAQVRSSALAMLDRLRDLVWCIDPEHDNQQALVRRMRSIAATLLADRHFRFTTSLPAAGKIPLAARRNLLLVYKEALHNIVRHSQARHIEIRLGDQEGDLVLDIADDGIGFEVDSDSDGYGLRSLHRRAREMGATLRVGSRPGGGCKLNLRIRSRRRRRRFDRRPSPP